MNLIESAWVVILTVYILKGIIVSWSTEATNKISLRLTNSATKFMLTFSELLIDLIYTLRSKISICSIIKMGLEIIVNHIVLDIVISFMHLISSSYKDFLGNTRIKLSILLLLFSNGSTSRKTRSKCSIYLSRLMSSFLIEFSA
jgi:hypothetical protein